MTDCALKRGSALPKRAAVAWNMELQGLPDQRSQVLRLSWLVLVLASIAIGCEADGGGAPPLDDVISPSDTDDATDTADTSDIDDTSDVDAVPPPGEPPREIRGLRARWADEQTVELSFLTREEADAYSVCWGPIGEAPQCEQVLESPVALDVANADAEHVFTVEAIRDDVAGPIVERHHLSAWEPRAAVPVWVEMDPADLTELYARDVTSDDQLPATLRLGSADGPEVELQGLRFRGSASRNYPRKGFNIRLDERPEIETWPFFNFRSEARRAGNRLLLNATWTDPTAMRPALSFGMYAALGHPAPDTFFADLYLNGVWEGIYVGVERIDREALRGWELNRREGGFSLFRDQAKGFRPLPEVTGRSIFAFSPTQLGATTEEQVEFLQEIVDYRGELEDHNWEALRDLAMWVHDTEPGEDWASGFEERFDVDAFLDVIALHVIQDDRDSLDVDYWLYRDEDAAGRWILLPWDKNLTFSAHWFEPYQGANDFLDYDSTFLDTQGNRLVSRTLQTPSLRAQLDARIESLLLGTFDEAWAEAQRRELVAEVRPSVEQTPEPAFVMQPALHHGVQGWFPWHVEALFESFLLRRALLLFQVSSDDGADRGELSFQGDVVFGATGRAWIQDASGWVMATLQGGEPGARHAMALNVVERSGAGPLGRAYEVAMLDGDTFEGELTLYFRNAPPQHWFSSSERDPHALWGFTLVDADDDTRVPTRVQPFVNALTAEVRLEGERTFIVADEGL